MAQELPFIYVVTPESPARRGGGEMKKWLNNIRSRISALTSTKIDDSRWQETAAMVYDGDIYAVLLRDRAARRLSQASDRSLDHRRDASWPFIR